MLIYRNVYIQKDTIKFIDKKKIGLKLSFKRNCGNSSFKFHGEFVEEFRCSYLKGPVAVSCCISSRDSEQVISPCYKLSIPSSPTIKILTLLKIITTDDNTNHYICTVLYRTIQDRKEDD